MNRTAWTVPALAIAAMLLTSCGEDTPTASPPADSADPDAGSKEASNGPESTAADISADDYDRSRFDASSTIIDHPLYPLTPGKRLDYEGSSIEDGERLTHQVSLVVTDLTKVVDDVKTVVIWERDYTDGELVETELAMFAQDTEGHVWHFGQYPEEYEDGEFTLAPAWIHGLEGAKAGITIPATPVVGTNDFAQGYAPPPLNWVDRGRVFATDQETCVPAGCFDEVVVIEESEVGLPDAYQDKHYAPGVGVVRVGWRGSKDENKEVLELTEVSQLDDAAIEEARREVLVLEEQAYERSKDVFALTERMVGPDA